MFNNKLSAKAVTNNLRASAGKYKLRAEIQVQG